MTDAATKLTNLMDALVEDLDTLTDDELLQELREDGHDPFSIADGVRDCMNAAIEAVQNAGAPKTIHVNGRPSLVNETHISYEDVLKLANAPDGAHWSVSVTGRCKSRSLVPGQSMIVLRGLEFDACDTSSA